MHKRRTDDDIDLRYPNHERVYKHLSKYGEARADFLWLDSGMRASQQVDSPPLDWREDNPTTNRCHWWTGTQRKWQQDILCIRGREYPVVVYFWELKYGNPANAPLPGLPRGKKLVVRPVCCHYQQLGICVNPYHYEIRAAGSTSTLSPKVLHEIRSIWRERQLTALQIAASYGLAERRVYRIVEGVQRVTH